MEMQQGCKPKTMVLLLSMYRTTALFQYSASCNNNQNYNTRIFNVINTVQRQREWGRKKERWGGGTY